MKSQTHSLQRAINSVPAVLLLLTGLATGNSYAASCQSMLQGHYNWVTSTPGGYDRTLAVIMVSDYASRFVSDSMASPEATYFTATVDKGGWIFQNSLVGSGNALFNNRTWSNSSWGYPSYPFDPNDPDKWSVFLNPSSSSMSLVRDGTTLSIPLDCTGNLASGVYASYLQIGSFKYYTGDTRYVVSISRSQYQLPK